jgi:hypothetical protein
VVYPESHEDLHTDPCSTLPLEQLVQVSIVPEHVSQFVLQDSHTVPEVIVIKDGQELTHPPLYKYLVSAQEMQVLVVTAHSLQLVEQSSHNIPFLIVPEGHDE